MSYIERGFLVSVKFASGNPGWEDGPAFGGAAAGWGLATCLYVSLKL